MLIDILKKKFDKIYILSLVSRKDRQNNIYSQFCRMLLPPPDMTDYIRWYYAVPFKFNNILTNAMNAANVSKFTKVNEYDCARNHYNIVRICYELGYDHILIIEDDARFIKDTDKFQRYIENIPNDYDIIQFGGFTVNPKIKEILSPEQPGNPMYRTHKGVNVWNNTMYALSRRGMEYYMVFMERFFWVADGPVYMAPENDSLVKKYITVEPLVIQANHSVIPSDIRNSGNDSIDYNKDNAYEQGLDKNEYY